MRQPFLLGTLLAFLCALPGLAWAQGADTGAEQRNALAETLDQRARTAYRLGEFEDAITQWKEAYRISSHAVFLYNIAQCHRRKEEFKSAIFFYKQFLQEDPKTANRADVESRIAELEKLLVGHREIKDAQPQEPLKTAGSAGEAEATETASSEEPGEPTPATTVASTERPADALQATAAQPVDQPSSGKSSLKLAGMGTGGAGIVLVGVGIVYAFKASSAQSDVEAARTDGTPWSDELQGRLDSGEQAALVGKLTIGLGTAALIGGGVLYFLGNESTVEGREHAGLQITPRFSSDDFSVSLGSRF